MSHLSYLLVFASLHKTPFGKLDLNLDFMPEPSRLYGSS